MALSGLNSGDDEGRLGTSICAVKSSLATFSL